VEVPWAAGRVVRAPGGVVRALGNPPMHRHCIVGSRCAPKVGGLSITCEDLVRMAVARLVHGVQVNDSGPMDPK